MTTREASRQLRMGVETMLRWLKQGVLPPPSFIDDNGNGVRYFDQEWLRKAKELVKSKRGNPEGGKGGKGSKTAEIEKTCRKQVFLA